MQRHLRHVYTEAVICFTLMASIAASRAKLKAVAWSPSRENRTDLEQKLAELAASMAESYAPAWAAKIA